MPLGLTFWSNNGALALWHDLSNLTDGNIFGVVRGSRELEIACCKIYQEPRSDGGEGDISQKDPGHDTGFFYMKNLADSTLRTWTNGVFFFGAAEPIPIQAPSAEYNGQWKRLEPYFEVGDLVPAITPSGANAWKPQGPIYKTGFLQDYDAAEPAFQSGSFNIMLSINTDASIPGDWRLWHYSPLAWSGTPPEVIASAAMQAGFGAEFIDQDAFDNAHDAYDLSTGDSPWSDLDDKWTLHARRTVGNKVMDFIIKCAEHGRDLLFFDEEGKLSISSWTRPNTATGFTAEGDQILDVLSHANTMKYLFNIVRASWGSAVSQSWGVAGATSGGPLYNEITAEVEPNLENRDRLKWIHFASDTGSALRFGPYELKGTRGITAYQGQPKFTSLVHFPFLLSPFVNRATLYKWSASTDGGGMLHVTHWLDSDSQTRSEIEIRQGPMGFDTGIGDLIEDLAITGDGRTIAEARIIERTYNFDTLTMDSTIMEIPPNT